MFKNLKQSLIKTKTDYRELRLYPKDGISVQINTELRLAPKDGCHSYSDSNVPEVNKIARPLNLFRLYNDQYII